MNRVYKQSTRQPQKHMSRNDSPTPGGPWPQKEGKEDLTSKRILIYFVKSSSITFTIFSSMHTFPPGEPMLRRNPLFTEAVADGKPGPFCIATKGNAKISTTAFIISLTPSFPPPGPPQQFTSLRCTSDIRSQISLMCSLLTKIWRKVKAPPERQWHIDETVHTTPIGDSPIRSFEMSIPWEEFELLANNSTRSRGIPLAHNCWTANGPPHLSRASNKPTHPSLRPCQ